MRKGVTFWLVCLSLVLTRLVGLHLHACAGVEAGVSHAGTHYADNGFLFGDHHAEDDGDDREIDLVALTASKPAPDFADLIALIPAAPAVVSDAERLLTVVAPRGPPPPRSSRPPHFAPPLRGPPENSLT